MPGDEIEAVTESAKAVQEVAKLGGKAIDAGRDAGGWLNRIFGQWIEDAVGLHWSDRVKARRIEAAIYDWERLTVLVHKTEARLKEKGITHFRALPPKIALPLLECATVEHEDDLHSLWANLLATGLDAAAEEIEKKYVTILSELTSKDARILKTLYRAWKEPKSPRLFGRPSITYDPSNSLGTDYDETAIITLNRLGLVKPVLVEFRTYQPADYAAEAEHITYELPGDLTDIEFTVLGEAFCNAVMVD